MSDFTMLKKVSLHNPSDTSCMKNKRACSSICKSTDKEIFCMCKSGRHVTCNNCQCNALNSESKYSPQDDGDYVPEKECSITNKKEILFRHFGVNHRDMSSGDHSRPIEAYKDIAISNYEMIKNSDLLSTSTPKSYSKCEPATMVLYKNEKFHDDRPNITTDYVVPLCKTMKEHTNTCVDRPVVCPITSCAKIVTINSFSTHFNFDHSKVPRIALKRNDPQEFLVNCSALSEETKCVATFIISRGKRTSQTALGCITSHTDLYNFKKDGQLLLLMAVKLRTRPTNFAFAKHNSRDIIQKSSTMIDDSRKRNMQDNISCLKKCQSENQMRVQKYINDDDNGMVLLWLCRLYDKSRIYTLNVMSKDKRQGYSYIGDAVHIRNDQDPISIYESTECLSLRGKAIKKLITAENELKVIISTM